MTPVEWDDFTDAIRERTGLDDLALEARHDPHLADVRIYKDGRHLATVLPTRASIVEGESFMADFLSDGEHYDRFRALLSVAVDNPVLLSRFPRIADEHLIEELPPEVSAFGRQIAIDATLAFRTNLIEDKVPHEVPLGDVTVTLWPPTEHNGVLGVPFEYRPASGSPVHGRLCTRRDGDVLALAIGRDTLGREEALAWIAALHALRFRVTPARSEKPETTVTERDQAEVRRLSSAPAHVSGHTRRLRPGERAGEEAQRRARHLGVPLDEGKTWVRPYDKNNPDDGPVTLSGAPSIALDQIIEPERDAA